MIQKKRKHDPFYEITESKKRLIDKYGREEENVNVNTHPHLFWYRADIYAEHWISYYNRKDPEYQVRRALREPLYLDWLPDPIISHIHGYLNYAVNYTNVDKKHEMLSELKESVTELKYFLDDNPKQCRILVNWWAETNERRYESHPVIHIDVHERTKEFKEFDDQRDMQNMQIYMGLSIRRGPGNHFYFIGYPDLLERVYRGTLSFEDARFHEWEFVYE